MHGKELTYFLSFDKLSFFEGEKIGFFYFFTLKNEAKNEALCNNAL